MTHPDNWVQKQIDESNNMLSAQQNTRVQGVSWLEELARLDQEQDMYHQHITPRRCLVCGKFHTDTGLPCTDYPWKQFYHQITTEDDMKDLRQWVIKDTKVPVFRLYYDKTLHMSEGKLAAQVGHVVAHLTLKHGKVPSKIIVLEASHTKFESHCKSAEYVQRDLGLTEVEEGTATVCGSAEFE